MSKKTRLKTERIPDMNIVNNNPQVFEADNTTLQSLHLIAAPNYEDDLTEEELAAMCKDPTHSPELINHLIEYIKSL